eukprot:Polyplicarium_translucidae@DN3945_c0_g1_i1.p2
MVDLQDENRKLATKIEQEEEEHANRLLKAQTAFVAEKLQEAMFDLQDENLQKLNELATNVRTLIGEEEHANRLLKAQTAFVAEKLQEAMFDLQDENLQKLNELATNVRTLIGEEEHANR